MKTIATINVSVLVFLAGIISIAGCTRKIESTADPVVAKRYCIYKVEHTAGVADAAVAGDISSCERTQAVNPIKIYADTLEPVKKP